MIGTMQSNSSHKIRDFCLSLMDVEFSSLTILLYFFIFLIALLKGTSMSKTKSKPRLNLPLGPRKMPLIGNLHLFASSHPPHCTLRDLALKYGPLMHLQLGEVTTVIVSSPEIAEEVLKTHDSTFAYRPSLMATEFMCYKNTDIAFSPYGEYWRQLRKICTLELLSMKRVHSFRPIREEEFSNLCRWIASNEGSSINLTKQVNLTTCDITSRASFGKKTDEQATFISTINEAIELAAGFHIGDLYPSIKLFRLISGNRSRVERLHQESDRILENIVNEHKIVNAANETNKSEKHEDLVDVLLKFHDAANELPLTNDNIKAVLIIAVSFGVGVDVFKK
ncbi:hypothetical protein BUALT_Bualt18G0073300 [Buddleja alternifolia]|uniref:Cytochrome P450 n=1 Tax=Buddleja alternifolia TaxID=168488 RepID=A0AAV6W533_9LAMI|nr:hypothetical protein BUALT_Bualt18G0073300 [Buddleja alternifolia]